MRKVYVYAICKNEEKHIKRWYNSMKEADAIYCLDTGSTDNSVQLLKDLGVNVTSKTYEHFSFAKARNDSLSLVPKEECICVCTDIDEILDQGWRKKLESIWKDDTKRVKYNMNFSFDEDGKPISTYYISKIHTRFDYIWQHDIHEAITYIGKDEEKVITTNLFNINHYPDRSKSRSFYFDLLKESVKNNKENSRDSYYLAREYMYNKMYQESIDEFIRYLNLKTSNFTEEKSSALRYIANCYKAINRKDEEKLYIEKSITLTPNIKEGYVLMGIYYYELKNYKEAINYLTKANIIKERSTIFINEEYAWNETTNDLLSLCYYYLGLIKEAKFYAEMALIDNPKNERIKNNLKIFEEELNS